MTAMRAQPEGVDVSKAAAFARSGRFDDARTLLESALRRQPKHLDAWVLLAQLHLHCGVLEAAREAAARAIELDPRQPDSLYVLGRVHKSRGERQAAASYYRRAVDVRPEDPDLLTSLGIVLRESGELEAAIDMYRRALRIQPNHPQANHNLGNALKARGSSDDAREAHDRGRGILASQIEQLKQGALAALREDRVSDAMTMLERLLHISPAAAIDCLASADYAVEMSKRQLSSTRLKIAEAAASQNPQSFPAADLVRRLAIGGGLYDRAQHYSDLALALMPSDAILLEKKLALPAIQASMESIRATRQACRESLAEILASDLNVGSPDGLLGVMAFYLAYHGENDRDLQIQAAQAILKTLPNLAMTAPHCTQAGRPPGKIRIGFISRFFSSHSIAKTSRGLIDKLSRERFDVFVLRITPSADDEMTRLIRASADRMVALDPNFFRAREQIAALELDILFYQDIGMEPISYFLAFARLARVQCVSFGHPNTTGIPNMDYFVSNDRFETAGAEHHYSERLFLLRDLPTLAYYYRPPPLAAAPDRGALGLPADATVYLCPQTLFKLHPDFDAILCGILEGDPRGIVAFIQGEFEEWSESLRQRFARSLGGNAGRVAFLPRLETSRFLELLAAADVVLDTLHFNGMNSSLESFAMGTPVVTLPTRLQRGRHTQAMYMKMEILDCVANSAEEYVSIAVRLGTEGAFRDSIRSRIGAASPMLFEQLDVVREFERFFVEALRQSSRIAAAGGC